MAPNSAPRRAVVLTGHFPDQKRRASIPWLCDHLRADGWHVTMVTVGYSWISRLLGDRRFQTLQSRPHSGITRHDDALTSVFGYAPIHPFSTGSAMADRLVEPVHGLFAVYWRPRLAGHLARANLVVIESGAPILLAGICRQQAPQAALVFKIADDVRVLGLPDLVARAELDHAPLFDRISVASPVLARRFAHLDTVAIDHLGVPKAELDRPMPDPFRNRPRAVREAVCVGTTLLDQDTVIRMAGLKPDWNFHIIGRLRRPPATYPANLILHGELPFADTAAWTRHADIGLAPYLDRPGVEYQTQHSNRMLMYRYFGVPMIGPARICDPEVPSLVGYDTGDAASLSAALDHVAALPRPAPDHRIQDWSVFARRIAATQPQVAAMMAKKAT